MTIRNRKTTLFDALGRAASAVRSGVDWAHRFAWLARRFTRHDARVLSASQGPDVPGVRSAKLARLEAALFCADAPLTTRRIAEIANLKDGSEARSLVQELRTLYDADSTAFTVDNVAGGWQLRTRREFAPWLRKLDTSRQPMRLSQPALQTLAVVAYRQPVLRTDIEAIRGVACGEMLRQLIERGLVRVAGHHDSLGRPLLYGTTRRFLEVFGLADLSDLPMAEQLRLPRAAEAADGAAGKAIREQSPNPKQQS